MNKHILLTGSTDGIGLETAKMLASLSHHLVLHGRNAAKLDHVVRSLQSTSGNTHISGYVADLSRMTDVELLAKTVANTHTTLDVLINNAGVYHAPDPLTQDGLDVRFAVNTIAPYLLTQRLLPNLGASGRIVNVSSAAQSPVNLKACTGHVHLSAGAAYAQSKLALTMWSCAMARSHENTGLAVIAVNPGSMLGTKMVQDAFGVAGGGIRIGAEILVRSALTDEFASASGCYFDNDAGRFASPHPDALDPQKSRELVRVIETIVAKATSSRD